MASFLLNSDSGIIADMLPGAGELVEESGLAGIRIARQGHGYFVFHCVVSTDLGCER